MSLKLLARSLGLSPTTVSRALNGFPEVGAATRSRVLAAAAEIGYRPDRRARSLATGRAMAIGHVVPAGRQDLLLNPIFGDFIAGAGAVYAREGYDMVLSVVPDAEEPATYRRLGTQGAVDGVIVHGPVARDPRLPVLAETGLPFVVHGRASGTAVAYSWVDVDNRRAFARLTDYLIGLGHRRFGLINGPEDMDFAARRRAGFVEALAAAGLAPDPALMDAGPMTEARGWAAARAMLRTAAPPTAILTASIFSAIGARRAVEEAGLRPGRDVSVATFDDDLTYLRTEADAPPFTAVRSSVREAGARAAAMLIGLIREPGPPRHDLLTAALVLGLSTAPPPG